MSCAIWSLLFATKMRKIVEDSGLSILTLISFLWTSLALIRILVNSIGDRDSFLTFEIQIISLEFACPKIKSLMKLFCSTEERFYFAKNQRCKREFLIFLKISTMDLLTLTWIIIDVALCIVVPLLYRFKNDLPDICGDIITWGKTRGGDNGDLPWFRKIFLVPNRWFIHFYALGLTWNAYLLFTFYQSCMQDIPSLQGVLVTLLPTRNGNSSNSGVNCFSVFFTLSLLTIQLTRRLYESLFVASFTGKMHLGHYAVGFMFYGLVSLTVVTEIPTPLQQGWCNSCQRYPKISLLHLTAVFLFAWASYHQYNCHKILGTLKATTPSGRKVYEIPRGDWFNYVSSPHYLAEIIIYIALFLAMEGFSRRWLLVLLFVISNLHHGATVTHQWYRRKFEAYPKDRTILIPYVY